MKRKNSSSNEKKLKAIEELTSVVIYINKDNLFSNFYDKDEINYDLIIKKILLPFFKMKSRILKHNTFFKIGEIEFKVAGVLPVKKGLVTSRTYIKCNNYFSSENTIKRALFITMEKYQNLTRDEIISNLMKPNSTYLVNKNDILKVKQKEFFVRNCEPETGRINNETTIIIENRDLLDIKDIKIAIIKVKLFYISYIYLLGKFPTFPKRGGKGKL